ncbi:hypothetical protein JKP88DRAFT_167518 [Tribonema minus]|uniref:Laccase n=1 Tax=Tribonema minus TaxID=303371 RepID=A0A835YQ52_9STRA|nr:hypothetical protein JKP88DRAFT_167518 [Tribonema minus]
MDSKVPIQYEDLLVISRGSRQPFRMYYHDKSDTLFLADVGQGDGPTTERIFQGEGISKRLTPAMSKTPYNWGWPCVEGVYGSVEAKYEAPDVYAVYDADSEQTRGAYLAQNNLDTCAPVYAAVQEYTGIGPPAAGAMPAGTVADAQWRAPIFEYRDGVIDPEFPEYCQNDGTASITAMHVSDSKALPLELQGKLFFGDHVKGCVWYFDADANGAPDATKPPHVLMTRTNAVDIRTGPDGALYIIDYDNTRITRAFARGKGPGALNEGPTDPPTAAPTPAPFAVPEVNDALQCFDGAGMPELQWTRNEDGTYGGDLIFDAVNLNTPNGVVRTRAFNYMVSAPVIRMKACNTYKLNVNNNLVDWPVGIQEAVPNSVHDPTVMNIHLHGLHISGEAPSDDVFTVVAPGDTVEYTYAVPCDHAGGHHWYHPHHHGSTALQLGGGAAGLLIIEPGPREASTIPAAFSTMPEQHMIIYDFDLKTLANVADGSGDPIFAAPDGGAAQTFAMVNGCGKVPTFQIEAGQWTKLRILNVGATYNVALTLAPPAAGILPCDVMLIAKDGVPVNDAPRAVAKNMMFMSLASRLEVAVRCPIATLPAAPHLFTYQHFGAAGLEKPPTIATVTVVASYRDAAPDLPPLAPCRATYLTSSAAVPLLQRDAPFQIAMRGDGINSEKFTGEAEDFHTFILDKPQRWTVAGSFQHPVHVHVNHMEIAAVTPDNDIDGIPEWNVVGDWIDTLAVPNGVDVYVRAERFTGKMMIHCHIAQHSDLGVTKVMNIVPNPAAIAPLAAAPIAAGGPADIQVADWGTCPALIPASTPFNVGAPAAVPGVIQAEEFDLGGEGIAYHNINLDRGAPPAMRAGEASVEIDTIAVGKAQVTAVGYIRDGEWLKYSVNIAAAGFYTASLTVAAAPAPLLTPLGMHWSLWLDVDGGCPAPGTPGKLLTVADDKWNGTGGALVFAAYDAPGFMRILAPGPHTITLCFEGNAGFELDSLTIAAWKPAP